MTTNAHRLMGKLLDYVVEQGKEIDPRAYDLTTVPAGSRWYLHEVAGLPGVEQDIEIEGDHLWLRVARLAPVAAPQLPAGSPARGYLVVADDPAAAPPRADEAALARAHAADAQRLDAPRVQAAPPGSARRPGTVAGRQASLAAAPRPATADDPARPAAGADSDTGGPPPPAAPVSAAADTGAAPPAPPRPALPPPTPRADAADRARREAVAAALRELVPRWTAWAASELPRRRAIAFYGDLFALRGRLEAEEAVAPSELVWGLGVSSWRLPAPPADAPAAALVPDGVDFRYPLLTQGVEIELDRATHALSVRPRAVEPRLEFDAFGACGVPGAAEVEQAARRLLDDAAAERPVSPFDAESFEPVLALVAGRLDDRGRRDPACDGVPAPGADLVVGGCAVLLARPRSNNLLVADIARLKERLRAGDELPEGPLGLVTPPSDEPVRFEPVSFRGLSSHPRAGSGGEVRELYFPLPYNREQETIAARLERSQGVAVQGPPGTGKTHTIANIVCHYLATGRKVLVTSKGEPALEVLQAKIPPEVRPLTVALLAGDREGMRQFQASIETILHELTHLDPDATEAEIADTRAAIERAHAGLDRIDRRVDDIAEAQLSGIEVDGTPMRPQEMAELVVAGEAGHGWLDDALTLAPGHAPPLAAAEAAALREARRRLGADLACVGARLPAAGALPSPAEAGELHEALAGAHRIDAALAAGGLPALRAATPGVLDAARRLLALADEAAAVLRTLDDFGDPWPLALRARLRRADLAGEREALAALLGEVDALVEARAGFLKRPVELPPRALEEPKAREAIERAAATGRPFGLLAFGAGEAKALVAAIRVAGLPSAGADDWRHVQRFVGLHAQLHSFGVRWNALAAALGLPRVEGGVEALREVERLALAAREAHRLATGIDPRLATLAREVYADPPGAVADSGGLDALRAQLRMHLERARLAAAAAPALARLREALAGTAGAAADTLLGWIDDELGDPGTSAAAATAHYDALLAGLRRVEALADEIALVDELSRRVEDAGAPRWAERLRAEPAPAAGDDPALPARWREAWTRARLKSHLQAIEARDELVALAARRREIERGLAGLYERLVSKSAWLSTRRNASPRVLAALETYRTAVRKIGQGTGPNATRHRRDAQRAMAEAQGAVPCWIMSHAKVSETLPAAFGGFDLVIVDEASQSNLWALPAVLRGARILVVGDDRQVSPEGGFVAAAKIRELKQRFLSGQPYEPVLTPEKSLYDIASTVYAARKVMLREHFRSVAPIIAYSNRRFYDGFIQPLRIPRASERIDPPLVDLHVVEGRRDARDVNRAEAEAIAAEIAAILREPRLAGRTLGVVSLLGPEQARHVDALVRSRCDAAELLARRFECGDARVFQGSERDIMFLSLVADREDHKALSGNMFEQRFNVAASRARDRMVLVRSVRIEDLSPLDLRVGLLEHFARPLDGGEPAGELTDRCESGFEREVYAELAGRGYRVVPQVRAGAFRIDLVVEGADDRRLAIECDGDDFHGPDRWQADMARQRVLERAGWTFWRCFASTWSLRREAVRDELLDTLDAMGIEPLGALERVPSLVEYREWRAGPADADANAGAPAPRVPAGDAAGVAADAAAAGSGVDAGRPGVPPPSAFGDAPPAVAPGAGPA